MQILMGEIILGSARSLPLTGDERNRDDVCECEAILQGLSDPCLYALVTTAGKPQYAALTT